ncbi:uncharacterized protein G2W53_006191 [Senna tora]|uniref:Uncharacterized protein n=1 Tax=Senna tora TaxID=362788 RepID=A0A834X4H9_9FABA|nr:uncharacterized protein G2W53_006191 [Senna tora]
MGKFLRYGGEAALLLVILVMAIGIAESGRTKVVEENDEDPMETV